LLLLFFLIRETAAPLCPVEGSLSTIFVSKWVGLLGVAGTERACVRDQPAERRFLEDLTEHSDTTDADLERLVALSNSTSGK